MRVCVFTLIYGPTNRASKFPVSYIFKQHLLLLVFLVKVRACFVYSLFFLGEFDPLFVCWVTSWVFFYELFVCLSCLKMFLNMLYTSVWVCVLHCTCLEDKRQVLGVSPSILWVPGIQLRPSGLGVLAFPLWALLQSSIAFQKIWSLVFFLALLRTVWMQFLWGVGFAEL